MISTKQTHDVNVVRVTEALSDKLVDPQEEAHFPRLHFFSGHLQLNRGQKDTGHNEIKQKWQKKKKEIQLTTKKIINRDKAT